VRGGDRMAALAQGGRHRGRGGTALLEPGAVELDPGQQPAHIFRVDVPRY